ncbi:protein DEFECTIVE IN EXINE FORMATION 1-like [Anneissia japonica]|uniref:protein DEFECTIVE IN EXINE FORMATION 1-like n=1 Tax=Anneissia japonica TaxID=1529436 RepID=UPI0014254B6C|nr:protein DEFECTIVE IN EXINE FORMATION 1-like [Anneissia japonica]
MIVFLVAVLCTPHQSYSQHGSEYEDKFKPDCGNYNLQMAWSAECGSGMIAATPLVADIDADGHLDIIIASFTEEISVIRGDTGQTPDQSHWPFRFPGATFHASPLLYDIDQDGQNEVLLTTSDGEIIFLTSAGEKLQGRTLKVGHVVVKKSWYDLEIEMDPSNIHTILYKQDYQLHSRRKNDAEFVGSDDGGVNRKSGIVYDGDYISIDAHVLATPVLADLNNDGRIEELIMPVTYYFDEQTYSLPETDLKRNRFGNISIENFLCSAIVVMNLTSGQVLFEVPLEMSKVSAEFPAYQLFTPTVIDLDGNSGPLEIIVCTSAGRLIVLDCNGHLRTGFPKSFGTIHGQVTVEDLDGNGVLELIVIDNSGNVMCVNAMGDVIWESEISGTSSAGSRVVDLNGDGILDVLVASDDGSVWAFKGDSGSLVEDWHHQLGGRITSNVLITNLHPDTSNVDIVIAGHDGNLYILSSSGQCLQAIELNERSLVQVLSANLMETIPGLELLLATMDGTLLSLAVGNNENVEHSLLSDWKSETPTLNQFTFWNNQFQVAVVDNFKELTGSTFQVDIDIQDNRPQQYRWKSYYVMIRAGSYNLGEKMEFTSAGMHQLTVTCPPHPFQSTVVVHVTNGFAQEITTTFTARFNMQWKHDVKWLMLLPLSSLFLLLLLVFGFPEADLLPTVHDTKYS